MIDEYKWVDYLLGIIFLILGVCFGLISIVAYTHKQLDLLFIFGVISIIFIILTYFIFKEGLK